MDLLALAAFVLAAVTLLGSPGPGIAALVAVGRSGGWRAGLSFYGGMQLGLALAAGATAAGLAAVLAAAPLLARALTWASAAYLLYLAARIATAPVSEDRPSDGGKASFAGGFLLGAANPKAYLAFLTLMAMRPVLAMGGPADAGLKWAVCVMIMIAVDFAWLWAGGLLRAATLSPKSERLLNLAMAAALAAIALVELI